ncbi:MAG: hypothetical protein ACFE9C_07350 [Candidatus Hodarchaeota archaeon]
MFNLEEFKDSLILEKIDKLNNYLLKNKVDRISKLLNEFLSLIEQQEYVVPITYIFSIIAENNVELITEGLIKKIEDFLTSKNNKVRVNSLIIIGFAMLTNSDYIKKYSQVFIKFLLDEIEDVRNNTHYFLPKLVDLNPDIVKNNIEVILEAFKIEKKDDNIISLLELLEKCEDYEFDHLYTIRNIAISLFNLLKDKEVPKIFNILIRVIKSLYPNLKDLDLENQEVDHIVNLLEDQFLMKKSNFTEISKKIDINLKEYLTDFKNSQLKNEKVYFYVKTRENTIHVYELEKSKLNEFFGQIKKISDENIKTTFSQVIDDDSELKVFINTLNNLKIIDGFYSNIGYFYSSNYLRAKFLEDLDIKGYINIKNFNFLPQNFIEKIIKDISISTNQIFLRHKDKETYTSLKLIKDKINSEAAKHSIVELKPYRDILLEEDFIKLLKNLPREYLSEFHKGTQWLTNLGTQKITYEVENSKIVGYFNISKISDKLNIGELLLLDVFDQFVDYRSGIWNKNKNIFYYSKYLKDKIDEISKVPDESEKLKQIEKISKDLNIDKNHILSKIDENLQLIAEEIKKKDQIKLNEYLQKTGMELDAFLTFIDNLEIYYFRKADLLIFNPQKIEEAKNEIKYMLIDKAKSDDYVSLGTMKFVQSALIEDLMKELLYDGKVKGIFYENEGEFVFYTERGIRSLMLENSFLFSFHDLFYGKELNQEEIYLLKEIFDDLVSKRMIRGNFDEETLTFSSDEVLFAKDYNIVLFEFEKMVNNYINKFEIEFSKIKKILTKGRETIFPQEIKIIQETIDKINEKYVNWRNFLEAFIRRTNKKLLREQGISIKQYKSLLSKEKKEEIKSLEEDPEVNDLLDTFNNWVKRYNKVELKYPNVIFYQKRLINNQDDKASKTKLQALLEELDLK